MIEFNNNSPFAQANNSLGAAVASRLASEKDNLASAACRELALPLSFIYDQFEYVEQNLPFVESRPVGSLSQPKATFLFPGNSEGAMPIYIITQALAYGYRVEAKLSQRCKGIQAVLAHIFEDFPQVNFLKEGDGHRLLNQALNNSETALIQVFGDDSWIEEYKSLTRTSKKTLLFDGPGKDPVIVLEDANIEQAVEGVIKSGTFAGGAACMSPERYFVHDSLEKEFLSLLKAQLSSIKPEQPDLASAVLGYLASRRAAERLQEQIAQALQLGATPLLTGKIRQVEYAGRDFYACPPMILSNVPLSARILVEETFGPVFPVQTFRSVPEAIRLAEDCKYGLTATVFGSLTSAEAVALQLRSSHALVYSNETMLEGFRPEYWGSGGYKRSGWVWETTEAGNFQTRTGYRPLRAELELAARRAHQKKGV